MHVLLVYLYRILCDFSGVLCTCDPVLNRNISKLLDELLTNYDKSLRPNLGGKSKIKYITPISLYSYNGEKDVCS